MVALTNDLIEKEMVNSVNHYMKMYPNEYKAICHLVMYDKNVKNHIDTHYQPGDMYHLLKTVEYYKELDNIENGIFKKTPFSLYAQKRTKLFKMMTDATLKYSLIHGRDKAYKMIDTITKYVNEYAN
jgi:hypothetical protein